MSKKLPCGHSEEEHEEVLSNLDPEDIQKLMNAAPTAIQALSLYRQALNHSAEKNVNGLFNALFFLVNSYDEPEKKPKQGWPPGATTVDEARKVITALALGAYLALDEQVRNNLSYPERWLVPLNTALPQ